MTLPPAASSLLTVLRHVSVRPERPGVTQQDAPLRLSAQRLYLRTVLPTERVVAEGVARAVNQRASAVLT